MNALLDALTAGLLPGKPYDPVADVRRVLLPRTRYHVYDEVRAKAVWILAVWHGARGRDPVL